VAMMRLQGFQYDGEKPMVSVLRRHDHKEPLYELVLCNLVLLLPPGQWPSPNWTLGIFRCTYAQKAIRFVCLCVDVCPFCRVVGWRAVSNARDARRQSRNCPNVPLVPTTTRLPNPCFIPASHFGHFVVRMTSHLRSHKLLNGAPCDQCEAVAIRAAFQSRLGWCGAHPWGAAAN
jgi:hypothetical protein